MSQYLSLSGKKENNARRKEGKGGREGGGEREGGREGGREGHSHDLT